MRAGAWWLVWVHMARLLRACRAKRLSRTPPKACSGDQVSLALRLVTAGHDAKLRTALPVVVDLRL